MVKRAFRGGERDHAGQRELEGLNAVETHGWMKTDSTRGTWRVSLEGCSRPAWLSGEGRVAL